MERKGLIFLGAPGSGKGTQAEILAREKGLVAISTGEMLRQAVESESALGQRIREIMASGELVDDETMSEVVEQRLREADVASGFILDGFPRTLPQAEALSGILERVGLLLEAVVFIDVQEEELVQRILARKRADDVEEIIRRRLEVYASKTSPVVEYYRQAGLLRQVEGNQTIAEVSASLSEALS